MPVAGLLIIFAPLGAAQSIYTTVGLIYNTQGRPDILFRWSMFASAMYVGSVGLRWGILGVAGCYAFIWLLLMVPAFMISFRLIQLSGKKSANSLAYHMDKHRDGLHNRLRLQGWRKFGIRNAVFDLVSTVVLGVIVYLALLLWRKPPVLTELAVVLNGSSRPGFRKVAQYLAERLGPGGL